MQFHNLQRNKTNRQARQVGRGGKRGTTSGRGTKGQKARSGHKLRPELRDIIKKLPKLRGCRFGTVSTKPAVINFRSLDKAFAVGETVNPTNLVAKKLINKKSGNMPVIKILATGVLTKALNFENCLVSESAKSKIEQAGGKILAPKEATPTKIKKVAKFQPEAKAPEAKKEKSEAKVKTKAKSPKK